jgi:OmpA-OmpF porin, OOP family
MSELLNSLKGQLSASLVDSLSDKLGENPANITKAMGGLLPTVLGSLINKSGDSSIMSTVMSMLGNSRNQGLGDNLSNLVSGNLGHADAANPASGLISALFGNKVDGVLGAISSMSGVKQSSSSALMGLASSMIMGFLGKKIAGGMGLSGLTSMLGKEAGGVMSALPSGMGNMLGISMPSMPNMKTPSIPSPNVSGGGMNWMWVVPVALLAAGLFWWKGRGSVDIPAVPTVDVPSMDSVSKAATAMADSTVSKVSGFFRKLSSGFELRGDSTGIESGLVSFIDSDKAVDKTTWFDFDHLNFKTGSAELDMDASKNQLSNINEVLKAFPAVHLKIGGYTDNTGSKSANVKLSQARAANVMAALVGMGIDATRLAAEGYGPQFPVCAANDTEACRAQNRRIAVRVTKK